MGANKFWAMGETFWAFFWIPYFESGGWAGAAGAGLWAGAAGAGLWAGVVGWLELLEGWPASGLGRAAGLGLGW